MALRKGGDMDRCRVSIAGAVAIQPEVSRERSREVCRLQFEVAGFDHPGGGAFSQLVGLAFRAPLAADADMLVNGDRIDVAGTLRTIRTGAGDSQAFVIVDRLRVEAPSPA